MIPDTAASVGLSDAVHSHVRRLISTNAPDNLAPFSMSMA
jgi:hypothetical protein